MGIVKKFRIKSFKDINPMIEFENISLSYGDRLILDNINFKINQSEIFGMLGPNGVGKSTIFNLITGLINPNNGKIKIDGEEVNEYPIYLRAKKFKNGNYFKGIANLGYRPTFNGKKILLEVHLFNFSENLYNKYLTVEFKKFIRKERKFKNVDQLKEQIKKDLSKAKKI